MTGIATPLPVPSQTALYGQARRSIYLGLRRQRDHQDVNTLAGLIQQDFLGLKIRGPEAQKRLKTILRKQKVLHKPGSDLFIDRPTADLIADQLARISARPVTPPQLVALLKISNQERLRWIKDGRLPTSGSVSLKRGRMISIPTYSVATIDYLLKHPHIIEAWQSADRA